MSCYRYNKFRIPPTRRQAPGWSLTGLIFTVLMILCAPTGFAASARTILIEISEKPHMERPDFKVPDDPHQLFFLQRSMNANTIVYAARITVDGRLDAKSPVDVYWRRFNGDGERRELSWLERSFAFGVYSRPARNPGEYQIEFKALPGRPMLLRQTGSGKFELTGQIGPYLVTPTFIFVDLDETSLVPRVQYLYLHGTDVKTGKSITETLAVAGGDASR